MIADVLNTGSRQFISRCAVIGKVHREGWTDLLRQQGPVTRPRTRNRLLKAVEEAVARRNGVRVEWKPAPPAPQALRGRDHAIPLAQRRTLEELTTSTCHWPIGDPREPGFFFCGADAINECPYCVAHRRKAYAKLSKPRRGVS